MNQLKVLHAMQKNRVSAECFNQSSGYGYNDMGRDTLEQVYADTFKGEDALVRPQITCGTHALALALMSNLRPGDELLSPVGKPYDTLEEVIGIRPSKGSLAEYGITYAQVDLLEDGSFDFEGIKKAMNESVLVNYKLGRIVKLFSENTTTRKEKVDIINRFNEVAKTINETKALYESVKRELNLDVKKTPMLENNISTANKTLVNETTVYQSNDVREMINLINRIERN
jgi:cystathionine beta-lyase family protein involved in aluminum resistance